MRENEVWSEYGEEEKVDIEENDKMRENEVWSEYGEEEKANIVKDDRRVVGWIGTLGSRRRGGGRGRGRGERRRGGDKKSRCGYA